jgi:putative oxidoreductase
MSHADAAAVNVALLVLRVVLGIVFLAHGINHLVGGGRIAGTARWFESLGMRPGIVHAWLASVTEVASGVLLIVGLLTPLAGAGVVGTMLVAWVTNHLRNGFFIFRPGEGYEYVMVLACLGVVVAILGAGEWSLDHALGVFDTPSWAGLLIALVAGVGGAVTLLLAFWRRPRPAKHTGS